MLCDLLVDVVEVGNFCLVHFVCVVFSPKGNVANQGCVGSYSKTFKEVVAWRETSHSFYCELFDIFPSESFEISPKTPNKRFVGKR